MKSAWFLAVGAVSGVLSAATTLFRLGDVGAPVLFGMCFGLSSPGDHCGGIDGAFYLYPGLVFGAGFAAALWRFKRRDPVRAVVFVGVSGIANAVAVFLCIWLFDLFGAVIDIDALDLPLALAGAAAGAAGGAVLSGTVALLIPGAAARWSILAAAILGLLTPLVTELGIAGDFAFYILWQAGYGMALAAGLPRSPGTVSA